MDEGGAFWCYPLFFTHQLLHNVEVKEINIEKAVQNFTGETVKKLRLKHNMNQEEFAKGLGVRPQAIGNYESGYRVPPKSMIMHILKVYGEK